MGKRLLLGLGLCTCFGLSAVRLAVVLPTPEEVAFARLRIGMTGEQATALVEPTLGEYICKVEVFANGQNFLLSLDWYADGQSIAVEFDAAGRVREKRFLNRPSWWIAGWQRWVELLLGAEE